MYFLFCYTRFYPSGGMEDYKGGFDTVDKAINEASKHFANVYEIVTLRDGDYIKSASLVVVKRGEAEHTAIKGETITTIIWEDCKE